MSCYQHLIGVDLFLATKGPRGGITFQSNVLSLIQMWISLVGSYILAKSEAIDLLYKNGLMKN